MTNDLAIRMDWFASTDGNVRLAVWDESSIRARMTDKINASPTPEGKQVSAFNHFSFSFDSLRVTEPFEHWQDPGEEGYGLLWLVSAVDFGLDNAERLTVKFTTSSNEQTQVFAWSLAKTFTPLSFNFGTKKPRVFDKDLEVPFPLLGNPKFDAVFKQTFTKDSLKSVEQAIQSGKQVQELYRNLLLSPLSIPAGKLTDLLEVQRAAIEISDTETDDTDSAGQEKTAQTAKRRQQRKTVDKAAQANKAEEEATTQATKQARADEVKAEKDPRTAERGISIRS